MAPDELEYGVFAVDADNRTLTGLLLPWDETSRTSVDGTPPIRFAAGTVQLPADPEIVTLNDEHNRFAPLGRATELRSTARGVVAAFRIARTPEGDAFLAGRPKRKLSPEIAGIRRNGEQGLAGRIVGAGLVDEGAWASAALFAIGEIAEIPDAAPATEPTATEGAHHMDPEETAGAAVPPVPAVPADVANAGAAFGVAPQQPAPPARTTPRQPELGAIFSAIARVKARAGTAEDLTMLGALSDITLTGPGALPADGVLQPNWLGQLYQGIEYQRQYITLGTLGTQITAAGKRGFKIRRGTEADPIVNFDGEWAGNKGPINSGQGSTSTLASTLLRFALGFDIGREFWDLPGGAEVIAAFFRLIAEDHLVWSDEHARETWISVAGAAIPVNSNLERAEYGVALTQLIQGILAVRARKNDGRRDLPTFAIVNDLAFEQLLTTPKDLIPEFVTFGINTDGTGSADGSVQVVNGDVGVDDVPATIVGARQAVQFDELPGGPLQVDALEIARGGIDRAIHGYLQTFIVRPEAVVLISGAGTVPTARKARTTTA